MTFLFGAGIGFLVAVVIGCIYRMRVIDRQLEALEPEIPDWVNRGIARDDGDFFTEFVQAVHIAQWEQELEDQP